MVNTISLLALVSGAIATTFTVEVGQGGQDTFSPSTVTAAVGDIVRIFASISQLDRILIHSRSPSSSTAVTMLLRAHSIRHVPLNPASTVESCLLSVFDRF